MAHNEVVIIAGGAVAAVVSVFSAFAARRAWLALRKYRGRRLVTCPESHEPAAVDVDTWHVLRSTIRGSTEVCLGNCSRWPQRAGCGQECLAEIHADPEGSRVQTLIEDWYAGKRCVYCKKPIHAEDTIDRWLNHGPALLDRTQMTSQWSELPPETLPRRLGDSLPVCWSCHEAEAFRRDYPELVTDRQARTRAAY